MENTAWPAHIAGFSAASGEAEDKIAELEAQHRTLLEKMKLMEDKLKSLDDWAGSVADRTDPDALWVELSEQDKALKDLEARVVALESNGELRTRPMFRGSSMPQSE